MPCFAYRNALNPIAFSLLLGASSMALPVLSYANHASMQVVQFNIPATSLDKALLHFAQQSDLALVFNAGDFAAFTSYSIQGDFTIEQALQQLIGHNPVQYQLNGNQLSLKLAAHSTAASSQAAIEMQTALVMGQRNANVSTWTFAQPESISVIDKNQLQRRPTKHTADMLELTTGVYSSMSQQDPALSVNIRGVQDYGRVNMNIDGMRQNFQKSGHGQRNGTMYIDSELLSSVEIKKGNTNGMGSAGTLAGVATFRTLDAADFINSDKQVGGKLHLSSGTNRTDFIGSGALAFGNEQADILLAASRRKLGDYFPGKHGEIGDIRVNNGTNKYDQFVKHLKNNKITHSNYEMTSYLAKAGLNLPDHQRLQFTYLQSRTQTPNASTLTNIQTANEYYLGWKTSGFSEVLTRSTALDYSFDDPDNNLVNLKAKLYYVDTQDDSDTYASSAWFDNSYQTDTRLQTYGMQLENTALFNWAQQHQLAINVGSEVFFDKSTTDSTSPQMIGVTPDGKRLVANLFTNFTYDYSHWLTLEAGLRYDYSNLKGKTQMSYNEYPYTRENPCFGRRITTCSAVKVTRQWSLDKHEGKISPSFRIAVRPTDWLEVFSSYGKSWRPVAITETLTSGSAHSTSTQYPNPYLDPETSKAWELGFNLNYSGLFTLNDQVAAKVAYFDTRVDNYINLAIDRTKPGLTQPSIGNAAYSNNLVETRFRGIEYQLVYDAGFVYGDLTFTHMIGKNNFCAKKAWLGGSTEITGEIIDGKQAWYSVENAGRNNYVVCDDGATFSSSAYLPGDRGSLTVGGRAFDNKLDAGFIVRFTPGYQDKSAPSNYPYLADWPKYTVYDLYAIYHVNENLVLSANVENLLDRAYVVSFGESLSNTLGRGRTITTGVEYKF